MIAARTTVATLALLLAACQPAAETPTPPPAAAVPAPPADPTPAVPAATSEVRLQTGGLTILEVGDGSSQSVQVSFGMAEADAIRMVSAVRGRAPTRARNEECGAGPLDFADWGDGLSFVFQDGRFVGWWANERTPAAYAADPDLHVGSTVAQVRAAYPALEVRTSTIGPELSAGDLFGTLSGADGAARVTALWAGTSCIFR